MNKKNIVFFIVDSVRSYNSGDRDDREKLKMMDKFEEESIYFPNAITAAASSIMSWGTMLTSLPSYYLARNYRDFKYDNDNFDSLPKILKENGYLIRTIFNSIVMREQYFDNMPHIPKYYWPKKTKHSQTNWSNKVVSDILENFLTKTEITSPIFLSVWYNVRMDPTTSDEVERGIRLLKENKLWEDTFFLLSSDHGYMDARRGYTPEMLQEKGLSHDLIMTDDNIKIPFYLHIPKVPPKKIYSLVSTYDILPTVLDFLNIDYQDISERIFGSSLLPLILNDAENKKIFNDRKIRSDARFFAQSDRTTSIRSNRYKYIIRPNSNIEEFYDLINDKWEEKNLINDPKYLGIIEDHRKFYKRTEEESILFQIEYLARKLRSIYNKKKLNDREIILIGKFDNYFLNVIVSVLEKVFIDSNIFVLVSRKHRFLDNIKVDVIYFDNEEKLKLTNISKEKQFLIIELRGEFQLSRKIESQVEKAIKDKKIIRFDPNFEIVNSNSLINTTQNIIKKRRYYIKNPAIVIKKFFKRLKLIKG